MIKRDLDSYDEKYREVYKRLVEEGEELFQGSIDKLTVFHKVLIDRVADGYVTALKTDEEKPFSEKKFKAAQEKLQKWLAMVFAELHSSKREVQARQEFYQKVVEVLNELVLDVAIRRNILVALKKIVDERGGK